MEREKGTKSEKLEGKRMREKKREKQRESEREK